MYLLKRLDFKQKQFAYVIFVIKEQSRRPNAFHETCRTVELKYLWKLNTSIIFQDTVTKFPCLDG
jgi:hypothetical protein